MKADASRPSSQPHAQKPRGALSQRPVLGSWDIDLTTLGRPGSGIDLLACWGVVKVRLLVTFKADVCLARVCWFLIYLIYFFFVMFVMFCQLNSAVWHPGMASLCSKPTGLARLPGGGGGGGEGGDLSVNCRPCCHATGYLLLKQGRFILRVCTNCDD